MTICAKNDIIMHIMYILFLQCFGKNDQYQDGKEEFYLIKKEIAYFTYDKSCMTSDKVLKMSVNEII